MNLNEQEYNSLWFKLSEPWNMQVYVCVWARLCVSVCVCIQLHTVFCYS